jgi:hypothetical protein
MKCKNCNHTFDGFFCNNCGQNSRVNKINLKNFLEELSESVFQVNRGLLFTIKELFTRPGHSIREFIIGKRKNHFKPIAYALTLSTVYFILSQISNEDTIIKEAISGFLTSGEEDPYLSDTFKSTLKWLGNNPAYTALILTPIYALASYLVFIDKKYNYLEHIVLNSYIVGQQAIIYSIFFLPVLLLPNNDYINDVPIFVSVLYALWTFRTFFKELDFTAVLFRLALAYILYFLVVLATLIALSLPYLIMQKL